MAAAFLGTTSSCAFLKPAKSESHFYVLTGSHHSRNVSLPSDEREKGCIVRLEPVEVANYLQTKDMAVREGTNQVAFHLFHRWAEPLDAGIRRVLAEDLRAAPGIRAVVTYQPAPAGAAVYNVSVHVLACEGAHTNHHGSAVFEAAWEIAGSGAKQTVLAHGIFEAPKTAWHPGNYDELASQLSRALDDFSRTLANAISQQSGSRSSSH